METFERLDSLPPFDDDSDVPGTVLEEYVLSSMTSLNLNKASDPDGMPNWLLREYTEILAQSVSCILNSTFAEQKLPRSWN